MAGCELLVLVLAVLGASGREIVTEHLNGDQFAREIFGELAARNLTQPGWGGLESAGEFANQSFEFSRFPLNVRHTAIADLSWMAISQSFVDLAFLKHLTLETILQQFVYTQYEYQTNSERPGSFFKFFLNKETFDNATAACVADGGVLYGTGFSNKLDLEMATIYPGLQPWMDKKKLSTSGELCGALAHVEAALVSELWVDCSSPRPFICVRSFQSRPAVKSAPAAEDTASPQRAAKAAQWIGDMMQQGAAGFESLAQLNVVEAKDGVKRMSAEGASASASASASPRSEPVFSTPYARAGEVGSRAYFALYHKFPGAFRFAAQVFASQDAYRPVDYMIFAKTDEGIVKVRYHTKKMTFQAASDACQADGAALYTPSWSYDLDHAISLFYLYQNPWISKQKPSFGNPTAAPSCAYLVNTDLWRSHEEWADCDTPRPFVCEKVEPSEPSKSVLRAPTAEELRVVALSPTVEARVREIMGLVVTLLAELKAITDSVKPVTTT